MDDIRFYDFDFNLLNIENKASYINWTIKYNGIGTFEAHFPIKSKILKTALETDYLIAVQGENQAIITGKQANEKLVLYGRTPNWLLTKRVTPKFSKITGTPEEISRNIVEDAFSDVENFKTEKYENSFEKINFWRNVYNPTEKVVKECLDRIGAGHMVIADVKNKNWIYKMQMGKVRDLIISSTNKNAYNETYTEDFQDHVNGGWYESYAEDDSGSSQWMYIESDKEGIYKWIGVLGGQSESEAKDSLNSREWEKEISLETKDVKYKKDYFLGDTVKLKVCFGNFKTTISKKVKGVKMEYENGIYTENPIF
ncbi:MAG: hypothetical protein E7391_05650 [Ruminococcaceae bacterium]|nr:hypothetical protein [Oscillospiraceae bacterium]